jgi:molybdate transport system substrate-binding protein
VLILAFASLLGACSTNGAPASAVASAPSAPPSQAENTEPGAEAIDLTIFAAASLSGALEEVRAAYVSMHRDITLSVSTDSSAALETQIEQGAPADVFLSADTTNPEKLIQKGLSAGEAVTFAANKLIVMVPSDNPGAVTSPFDLAKPGLKVIAAGDEVPITKYSKQLVDDLAKQPGAPVDFAAAYARNVVSREDNVRAVIGKIELGEGDAAIVYVTDVKGSTNVATVDVPDAVNVRASYAGVVVGASTHQQPAREFLGWLAGPDGQAILAGFGFKPPSQ